MDDVKIETLEWTDLINYLTWKVMMNILQGESLRSTMIGVFNAIVRWQQSHPSK
jgi:hypothetical protein